MSSEGSITTWLNQLREGDPTVAEQLWQRYFHRLVGLAREKLRGAPRRAADEEDVALSAFDSLYRGVLAGRFPKLQDRDDLWRLLFTITVNKTKDLIRDENRLKRGGGEVLCEADLQRPDGSSSANAGLMQVVSNEPTPEFAALVADQCRWLLDQLDDELRSIALAKLEGDTNPQIADRLGCAERTIDRKLLVIRHLWEKEKP